MSNFLAVIISMALIDEGVPLERRKMPLCLATMKRKTAVSIQLSSYSKRIATWQLNLGWYPHLVSWAIKVAI